MTDILPQFISMFRHGIWGKMELPMMDDIAPLWSNLQNYVRHPEKAVSWPLAFSVHAMLTAILETDSITDSLMTTSDTTFHNFFHQVEWANSLLHDDSSIQYKTFQNNHLYAVLFLENLGLPSFGRRAIASNKAEVHGSSGSGMRCRAEVSKFCEEVPTPQLLPS